MKRTSLITLALARRRLPSSRLRRLQWLRRRPAAAERTRPGGRPAVPAGPGHRRLLGDAADQRRSGRLHLLRPRVPREHGRARPRRQEAPDAGRPAPGARAVPGRDRRERRTTPGPSWTRPAGRRSSSSSPAWACCNIEERVIVANAFPEGYTGIESEAQLLQASSATPSAAAPAAASAARRHVSVGTASQQPGANGPGIATPESAHRRQFASGWSGQSSNSHGRDHANRTCERSADRDRPALGCTGAPARGTAESVAGEPAVCLGHGEKHGQQAI